MPRSVRAKLEPMGGRTKSSGRTLIPLGLGVVIALATMVLSVRSAVQRAQVQPPLVAPQGQADTSPKRSPIVALPRSPVVKACVEFNPEDGPQPPWARELELCTAALKIEPTNKMALARKEGDEKELRQLPIIARARKEIADGQLAPALDTLTDVASDSSSGFIAKVLYRDALRQIMRHHGEECARLKARRTYAMAWDECKAFHDIACAVGEQEIDALYEKAFLALNAHTNHHEERECHFKYRFEMLPPTGCMGGENKDDFRKRFDDPELADAVWTYSHHPSDGLALLTKYVKHGRDAARAQRILSAANMAYTSHADVVSETKPLDQRLRALRAAIALELTFMPQDVESDFITQDRGILADTLANQAQLELDKRNYATAFQTCLRGYALTKANLKVDACLADLEEAARSLNLHDCADAQRIVSMTRDTADVHKLAASELARCTTAKK